MSRSLARRSLSFLLVALASLLALGTVPAAADPTLPKSSEGRSYRSCARATPGQMRCFSTWQPGAGTAKISASAVKPPKHGLRPADIRSAYKLPKAGGRSQTVAIVDAYDNPRVERDLAAYRKAFKLPKCTSANGCFRKVDQRGGTTFPEGDAGWGVEISLDVQAVSAACRQCRILLVEADDPSYDAIGEAVNTAVHLGADVVSNSYGAPEPAGTVELGQKYYTHPGVAMVASSGDDGFGAAQFPAVLASTWAVGGTYLDKTKKGRWTEDAWELAGSGCSAYIPKPAAQTDTHCGMRTVADVSAAASADYGFAVYDTYGLGEDNGWIGVQGTSLSAPLIAGMIGLRGNADKASVPAYAYAHRKGLKDVVGGSNGYCGRDYLCTGLKGYDAPTGLGSPRGLRSL